MKFLRAALFALLLAAPAAAQQSTVTAGAFAIGRGPGVSGYTSLLCSAGQLAVGQAGNPSCRTVSGDWTLNAAGVSTLATVNANVGAFGSATQSVVFTVNAKGLITAAANVTVTPAVGSITGLGAGCATFLGTPSSANLRGCLTDETGTGLAYFQGGDIGTPSAGVGTNLTGTAAGLTAGGLADPSASTPFGYAAGSGGTVTQLTSRTTGVTLNRPTGAITLFSAANNNVAWTTFTVTNSTVAANDNVVVSFRSSTDTLIAHVSKVSAGSFNISVISVLGTTVESPVIGFSVIRGSNT